MYKDDDGRIHETTDEAREGTEVKGMTSVLFVSIALVIVLFAAIWWFWMR